MSDRQHVDPLTGHGETRVIAGRYQLTRLLGRGGMGRVWLARDPHLARDVALKEIWPSSAGAGDPIDPNGAVARRAMREAQAMARLRHPGIVRVYDVVTHDDRPWIVMDYVDGNSLAGAIDQHGPLTERRTAEIGLQILDALDAAHRNGILHRDVKPGNVLLDPDRALLTDFGIAAVADAAPITVSGQIVGSLPYLSPERAEGRPATAAADLWALGVTLYAALTGRSPFQRDGVEVTLAAIFHYHPEPPVNAGMLWPVLKGLLAKNPHHRLTAEQARPLLVSATRSGTGGNVPRPRRRPPEAGLPPTAHAPADTHIDPGRPEPRRRRVRVVAALTALLVLSGAGIYWWLNRADRVDPDFLALPSCEQVEEHLRILSSPEKRGVLDILARGYGPRAAAGRCFDVEITDMASGAARDLLVSGWKAGEVQSARPDVWSPASSIWVTPVNGTKGLLPSAPSAEDSLFTSPVVIAMPEPVAEQIGWAKDKKVGWMDVLREAGATHSWGPFKLVKTNPNISTSGLIATVAAFSAFAGRTETAALEPTDVDKPAVRNQGASLEKSVVHSQEQTLDLLATLRRKIDEGPEQAMQYLSAAAIEENSLIMFNRGYPCGAPSLKPQCRLPKGGSPVPPATKLVSFYPSSGTLFSDHPYLKIGELDDGKAQVADNFRDFIRSPDSQKTVRGYGFRSHTGELPMGADSSSSADVGALPTPSSATFDKIHEVWPQLRKPLNVILAVDVSGSMTGMAGGTQPKIELLRGARKALIEGTRDIPTFADGDRIALWEFADGHRQLVPGAPLSTPGQKATLEREIKGLNPVNGTPTNLCEMVEAAVAQLREGADDSTNNAVIVLTDGDDAITEKNKADLTELLPEIQPTVGKPAVPVFTIAYGDQADKKVRIADKATTVLQAISDATGGLRGDASDPATISVTFRDLVSKF